MFPKLFKYDFRALGKPLALFAPLALGLAALGGLLSRVLEMEIVREYFILESMAFIARFFCMIGVAAFPFVMVFFCARRYYTHFFTDEGYLTFTLPVRRESLLWSKTLSAWIVLILAGLTELAALALYDALQPDSPEMIRVYGDAARELSGAGLFLLPILLFLLYLILYALTEIPQIHFCVTAGHLIAKKHRILAAFGLWYGINFAVSTVFQGVSFLVILSFLGNSDFINGGTAEEAAVIFSVFLSILCLLQTGCLFLFYFWNRSLLKKKLFLN
ncbi:MAG: hypothetical protein II776_08180 [Clostridia bacterium]|nr:hypothetical protein [Clostridia bacterium]